MPDVQGRGLFSLCLLVVFLLKEFSQSIACRGWLTSIRIEPLVLLLAGLLPSLERGVWWAWLCSYVLLSIVLFTAIGQYLLSLLPGNWVTLSSRQSRRAGFDLLSMLGMGLVSCLLVVKDILWMSAIILKEILISVGTLILLLLQSSNRPLSLPAAQA